ncbi:MAG: glutamate--tRNA ligase [Gemmatimonadota bacterium]
MIRTRFAPSPTGSLHVGNARIAILNWLFARRRGGTFVLRIEDTDTGRNVPGTEAAIRQDLLWLGLDWDEGPEHGARGLYRQSERGALYGRAARALVASGHAYLCFCAAAAALEDGHPGNRRERCACAALDSAAVAARRERESSVVRFRVPDDVLISFDDVIRGRIDVASAEIADFVLLRSDGRPTYNFAVVVDDADMRISHVIRGVGHLSNTPRQVLLYDALGARRPEFAHVPMVLGEDRQKLSKRHGAAGMAEYRSAGYHPDAVVNYLSLLSWSSVTGDEVLTPAQLTTQISLERIGVADVVFDPVKLRWLSAKHIERMSLTDLVAAVRPCVASGIFELDDVRLTAAVAAVRTHLATFSDINAQLETFFPCDDVPAAAPGPVTRATARVLEALDVWDEPALKDALQRAGTEAGVRGRALHEPLRLALTGREDGPPLTAVLLVQGRDQVLSRLPA